MTVLLGPLRTTGVWKPHLKKKNTAVVREFSVLSMILGRLRTTGVWKPHLKKNISSSRMSLRTGVWKLLSIKKKEWQ